MFDSLVDEIAVRFGVGDRARSLVRMLLAYVSSEAVGGLDGLTRRLQQAGLGAQFQSWLHPETGPARPLAPAQAHDLLGGFVGLVGRKLGIGEPAAAAALAYALPELLRKLSAGGTLPARLPPAASNFLGNSHGLLDEGPSEARDAAPPPAVGTAAWKRWLPWLVLVVLALLLFRYCSQQTAPDDRAAKPAPSASSPAATVGSAIANAIPKGAGALSSLFNDTPALDVFFDTGKADIPAEFAERAKAVVAHALAHPAAKLVVSGYSDPNGSVTANAEMAKQRAQAVAAALKAAGVPEASIVEEKPAEVVGTGDTNAESRRVEVRVRP